MKNQLFLVTLAATINLSSAYAVKTGDQLSRLETALKTCSIQRSSSQLELDAMVIAQEDELREFKACYKRLSDYVHYANQLHFGIDRLQSMLIAGDDDIKIQMLAEVYVSDFRVKHQEVATAMKMLEKLLFQEEGVPSGAFIKAINTVDSKVRALVTLSIDYAKSLQGSVVVVPKAEIGSKANTPTPELELGSAVVNNTKAEQESCYWICGGTLTSVSFCEGVTTDGVNCKEVLRFTINDFPEEDLDYAGTQQNAAATVEFNSEFNATESDQLPCCWICGTQSALVSVCEWGAVDGLKCEEIMDRAGKTNKLQNSTGGWIRWAFPTLWEYAKSEPEDCYWACGESEILISVCEGAMIDGIKPAGPANQPKYR